MTSLSPLALTHLAIIYVVWGSTYLAIRFAVAVWPPFLTGVVRFLSAGTLMLLTAKAFGHSLRLDRRALATSFLSGLLLFPVGNGAVLWAEQTTSSGLVATLTATVPIWMTLFAWLMGTHARPSLRVFVALALGLSGVALLVANGGAAVSAANAFILLVGAATWAFASVWVAKRRPAGSLLVRVAYQMLAGGAGFVLLALLHGDGARVGPALLAPKPLLAILYLAVFGSCIGYFSFSWLVAHVPPHIVGTYAFVNPVIAVILGAFFGEAVTAQGVLAIGLVVTGVVLAALPERRAELVQEPLAE
ncbi:MAG: EamA family transporter [Bacillota bacterium]|nr:EamA family transporter [Bacillota bacterium]